MKRKTVAIVLSAMMAIAALGGCGSTTANVESEKLEESQKAGEDGTAQSEGLAPLTFVRAQDSTVESSVFAKMEGSTYEDNIWTDLIAEKLGMMLRIFGSHQMEISINKNSMPRFQAAKFPT
ncbi:MAG: hypothetical protein ACLUOI_30145 [Eisenbergiella sp.]